MQSTTLKTFTNPRDLYNTAQFAAIGLGHWAERWGLHNLKYKFIPPTCESVRIVPGTPPQEEPEQFDLAMFMPGGFLHEVPLNFFIKLQPYSLLLRKQEPILINAGYLLHHLVINSDTFYKELARLLKDVPLKAEAASPSASAASDTDSEVQEESPPAE